MARFDSPSVTVSRRDSTQDDKDADFTVIWLRGDHDVATKVPLVVTIARAAQRDDRDLLVDLSEVTFMDASTIGALVRSRNRLLSRSRSLEVRAPSRPALRLLELCGLTHLILGPSPGGNPARIWSRSPGSVSSMLSTASTRAATGPSSPLPGRPSSGS